VTGAGDHSSIVGAPRITSRSGELVAQLLIEGFEIIGFAVADQDARSCGADLDGLTRSAR
jgi:hypothetical protein